MQMVRDEEIYGMQSILIKAIKQAWHRSNRSAAS